MSVCHAPVFCKIEAEWIEVLCEVKTFGPKARCTRRGVPISLGIREKDVVEFCPLHSKYDFSDSFT